MMMMIDDDDDDDEDDDDDDDEDEGDDGGGGGGGGGAWRKTISGVCILDHEKGVSSYAASYKCVCLFSATFQTTLCRYILFCELVHV